MPTSTECTTCNRLKLTQRVSAVLYAVAVGFAVLAVLAIGIMTLPPGGSACKVVAVERSSKVTYDGDVQYHVHLTFDETKPLTSLWCTFDETKPLTLLWRTFDTEREASRAAAEVASTLPFATVCLVSRGVRSVPTLEASGGTVLRKRRNDSYSCTFLEGGSALVCFLGAFIAFTGSMMLLFFEADSCLSKTHVPHKVDGRRHAIPEDISVPFAAAGCVAVATLLCLALKPVMYESTAFEPCMSVPCADDITSGCMKFRNETFEVESAAGVPAKVYRGKARVCRLTDSGRARVYGGGQDLILPYDGVAVVRRCMLALLPALMFSAVYYASVVGQRNHVYTEIALDAARRTHPATAKDG